ncbi:CopG family transcriptional regulator [Ferrovum sp.]|uniref:ribbon-helix-helix domain-containing protein n=1 Tax=Ferrovum sp. TaxID=2609467 RepID=UPI00345C0C5B
MMIRSNFFLSQVQVERLREMSRESGLSVSELVRRAIDEYLVRLHKAKRNQADQR